MKSSSVVDISIFREQHQQTPKPKPRKKRRLGGSIYIRNGILWVDFRYLGQRVRESSGLPVNPKNRKKINKQLAVIIAEIRAETFIFADWFPHSKKKGFFTRLEGRDDTVKSTDITFGQYQKRWWKRMAPGMSESKNRDYTSILNYHLVPYFGDMPFSQIHLVEMKAFLAHLSNKKTRKGEKISAKRIRNVFIPLHQIISDAYAEYRWEKGNMPFEDLELPTVAKTKVNPFSYADWKVFMAKMQEKHPWYRPYFEFAVLTGLRPSEQVALKWTDFDGEYFHIERSRVRNKEKRELKNEFSRRSIELNEPIRKAVEEQRALSAHWGSEYVFLNTQGRPILQDKLRELWGRLMKKTDVKYRRMYDTRHTFASWALAAGETPHWVATTMGHCDTTMIFKRYSRYIPNLTRRDGSAFERQYLASAEEVGEDLGHNFGHNGEIREAINDTTT